MIIHDVKQGSDQWLEIRSGIPTASRFSDILTKSGKPSDSAQRYMLTLLAERIIGHPVIEHMTMWQDRGKELEREAVAFFEFTTDTETIPVGFVTNDAGTWGASPDRFVGEDGVLEIKCLSEYQHVGMLLNHGKVYEAHKVQVQGQLMVTERKTAHVLSFHPEMPPALIQIDRDEKYIESLAAAVTAFSQQLESLYAQLCESGLVKAPKKYEPSLVDILKASMAEMNK